MTQARKGKRGGNYTFSQVPTAEIQRSQIDRSHGHTTAIDEHQIYPVFVDEALPGDTLNCRLSMYGRMATPVAPLMDTLRCDVHFFAVPNRLLWSNWNKFMGEQENPGDSTDYLVPEVEAPAGGGFPENTMYDYMGLPPNVPGIKVSALPFRAAYKIWNAWYRDQNQQNRLTEHMDDGPDPFTTYLSPMVRNKAHDYFSSALPWPQKGPGVELPLGTTAPVRPKDGQADVIIPINVETDVGREDRGMYQRHEISGENALESDLVGSQVTGGDVYWTLDPGLETDLTGATAATINTLRTAFQIQRLLERDARGGTRYTEILHAHFKVESPDQRLQRPEYLGGGSVNLMVNPVSQTSGTEALSTPQGTQAAYATITGGGIGFTKSFVEHMTVIGMMSIRGAARYQQGINRMWLRRTRYDFYFPAFAHLGEQEIQNQEIYAQDQTVQEPDGSPTNEATWGYQERWAEMRYKPSIITGAMRSGYSQGSLDFWHLGYDFDALPPLNAEFMMDDPPVERVVAVPSQPHFIMDMWFDYKCARPMPLYSVPGLIDHF